MADGTERKTLRLEAFSDAVLAIAITLPVVHLQGKATAVSEADDPAAAYAALAPDYLAYGLSVVVIGLYWAHSHFSGKIIEKTDHGFNLLTIVFLALVSVTPVPAGPFANHLAGDGQSQAVATVYAGVLAAPSLAWLSRYVYAARRGLYDPRLAPAYMHLLTLRYVATAAAFAAGFALTAWVDWRLGMAALGVVTLGYALPPIEPRYKPGEEPGDELEEADESPAHQPDGRADPDD